MAGQLDPKTGLLTQAPTGTTINETGIVDRPITTDSLKPTPALDLPKIPQPTQTEADTMVGGAGATAQNLQTITQQLTPQPTALDQQLQDLLGANVADTQTFAQKGADQLSAEQAQGIPQLKTQFGEINSQLAVKLAESKALDLSFQNANIQADQSNFTNFGANADKARNYREYVMQKNFQASQIGLLQAQAQGLQGQIGLAQETANRAVDLKYSVIENNLAVRKAQLEAIQPLLNKQEKVQALAQQTLLNRQEQEIADKKQEEKDVQNITMKAIQSGITDPKLLNSISQAKTAQEALQLAGPSIGKLVAEDRALDVAYKKLQMDNIRSEIANRGGKSDVKIVKINGQDYVQNADGTFSVPVVQGQTINTAVTAGLKDKISQIDKLIAGTQSVGTSVIGPTAIARGGENFLGILNLNALSGKQQEFVAGVHQLAAQEFLASILALKKQGGTLGALNEQEGNQLRQAATKINDWEIKKDGVPIGKWNISESAFRTELNTIKTLTQRALNSAAGSNGLINNLEQNLAQNPNRVAEYNKLVADNPGATEDEINQLMGF